MAKIILLVIGSAAGGLARYSLGGLVHRFCGSAFPYGTLAVNLTGCFVIGFLAALADDKFFLGSQGRLLLMIGFCGAFTTFSTFMLETSNLLKDGEVLRAFLNILASVVVGFLIFRLGTMVGDLI